MKQKEIFGIIYSEGCTVNRLWFLSKFSDRNLELFNTAYQSREICCFSSIKNMLINKYITPCEMKSFQFRFSPSTLCFPAGLIEISSLISKPARGFLWSSCLRRDRCDRINERNKYWLNFISELFTGSVSVAKGGKTPGNLSKVSG